MAYSVALGYPYTVWLCMRSALQAVAALPPVNTPSARATLNAAATTLGYGRDALAAWQTGQALSQAFLDLDSVLSLPITVDPDALALVTSRIGTLRTAALAIAALAPTPPLSTTLVASGQPGMDDPELVEYCMTAILEDIPSGLTIDNFADMAANEAAAWAEVSVALTSQGIPYAGNTLDTVNRMAGICSLVADDVAATPISSDADITVSWNWVVVMPAILRIASIMANDPTSASSQQVASMRFVIGTALNSINSTIVNLGNSLPTPVVLVKVRQGDTLMDIAAREMGDYTRWRDIATINGLEPPYLVPVRPNDGSAVAAVGDQIYLPTTATTDPITGMLSYETNYLGTDLNFGPLRGAFPLWTGDFSTITGYANLQLALGRRLQTTLGTLIYHSDYGSRIPPQVGEVQSLSTVGVLEAYAESALLADPRVDQVVSVTATLGANYAIKLVADVVPNGLRNGVEVNEVLQ